MSELRAAGRHWLEYMSTAAVLAISLLSLWVATRTEEANEKMVDASSWPLLQVESGNGDGQGNKIIMFDVVNSGAGTAKLESVEISWHGKSFASSPAYLHACCGFPVFRPDAPSPAVLKTSQPLSGRAVRAGDDIPFLKVPLAGNSESAWNKLDTERFKTTFRACYCSVFDQCWTSTLRDLHPVRIDKCGKPNVQYVE